MVRSFTRRLIVILIWCAFVPIVAAADPLVVTALNPDPNATFQNAVTLKNALFADGSGIAVSSVTYTGTSNASGTFAGGNGVIGLPSGILLTSGNVNNVVGPNTVSNRQELNGAPGDALLQALIPNSPATHDASVLELQIRPSGQTLQFKYVFGSEEYNEFSTSIFNDVFGFFVNGVNYALIPGTSTPVAINNINIGHPTTDPVPVCNNCAFFVNNDPFTGGLASAPFNTQLDGFTTVLSFIAPVIPGEVNTLTLAIADVGDERFDSAVFVLRESVSSPGGDPSNPLIPAKIDPNGDFIFDFFVVQPNATIWIDPIVAIGYTFTVNSGPNVQTIVLPNVGDGRFDIYDAAMNLLAANFLAGAVFDFGPGGASAFTILGIEESAGLDPGDPLAFVVGTTWAGIGQVNLTMDPITVPEPTTLLLLGVGSALVAGRRYRRRRG